MGGTPNIIDKTFSGARLAILDRYSASGQKGKLMLDPSRTASGAKTLNTQKGALRLARLLSSDLELLTPRAQQLARELGINVSPEVLWASVMVSQQGLKALKPEG